MGAERGQVGDAHLCEQQCGVRKPTLAPDRLSLATTRRIEPAIVLRGD